MYRQAASTVVALDGAADTFCCFHSAGIKDASSCSATANRLRRACSACLCDSRLSSSTSAPDDRRLLSDREWLDPCGAITGDSLATTTPSALLLVLAVTGDTRLVLFDGRITFGYCFGFGFGFGVGITLSGNSNSEVAESGPGLPLRLFKYGLLLLLFLVTLLADVVEVAVATKFGEMVTGTALCVCISGEYNSRGLIVAVVAGEWCACEGIIQSISIPSTSSKARSRSSNARLSCSFSFSFPFSLLLWFS